MEKGGRCQVERCMPPLACVGEVVIKGNTVGGQRVGVTVAGQRAESCDTLNGGSSPILLGATLGAPHASWLVHEEQLKSELLHSKWRQQPHSVGNYLRHHTHRGSCTRSHWIFRKLYNAQHHQPLVVVPWSRQNLSPFACMCKYTRH
eukprot:scaffold214399_cov20-Tisochrysis_lutea.AAC.2